AVAPRLLALSTRTSPPPIRVIGASTPGLSAGVVWMLVSAEFINLALTSCGDNEGWAESSSAADPAIIGVAPEVPPKADCWLPVPETADTDAPGAPMSGLIAT